MESLVSICQNKQQNNKEKREKRKRIMKLFGARVKSFQIFPPLINMKHFREENFGQSSLINFSHKKIMRRKHCAKLILVQIYFVFTWKHLLINPKLCTYTVALGEGGPTLQKFQYYCARCRIWTRTLERFHKGTISMKSDNFAQRNVKNEITNADPLSQFCVCLEIKRATTMISELLNTVIFKQGKVV